MSKGQQHARLPVTPRPGESADDAIARALDAHVEAVVGQWLEADLAATPAAQVPKPPAFSAEALSSDDLAPSPDEFADDDFDPVAADEAREAADRQAEDHAEEDNDDTLEDEWWAFGDDWDGAGTNDDPAADQTGFSDDDDD